jgi:hypothetical protein
MDYLLAGWKLVDIASTMKCTTQNLQDLKKSRIFQDELAQRRAILTANVEQTLSVACSDQEYVNQRLMEGTRKAVDKLLEFVGDDSGCSNAVARQAASDLLDRGGFPKLTKTENTQNTIFVMDTEDLERIKKTMELDSELEIESEEKSATETVIDVDFEPVQAD